MSSDPANDRPPFHEAYARAVYAVERFGLAFTFAHDHPEPVSLPFAEPWAIVTACNPRSVRLSDEENTRRMDELRGQLGHDGVPFVPSENRSPGGGPAWREPSVLITGAPRGYVLTVLRNWDQNAAVFGEGDQTGLLYADGRFIVMTPRTSPE